MIAAARDAWLEDFHVNAVSRKVVRPLIARVRRAFRKRAFLRKNSDVRRVFGAGDRRAKDRASAPAPLSSAELEHWNDFGFLVLKGFFDPSVITEYKNHIDTLWQERHAPANPAMIYTDRGGIHPFRDALDEDRLNNYRLLDQYLIDAPTRQISMHPRLTERLHQLMGYAPVVCNTILFEWGSEQDLHSDMFYMPPCTEQQMLATWIAFDDVTEDNGPLLYVPGSHKLPPHRFSHGKVHAVTQEVDGAVAETRAKMSALGLRAEKFFAKRGDVLIWHSQLIHGGDAIHKRSDRRTSLVTHYYSTCDIPTGSLLCAESKDGSLLLIKNHVAVS